MAISADLIKDENGDLPLLEDYGTAQAVLHAILRLYGTEITIGNQCG